MRFSFDAWGEVVADCIVFWPASGKITALRLIAKKRPECGDVAAGPFLPGMRDETGWQCVVHLWYEQKPTGQSGRIGNILPIAG
jgi:hypothetical protein